MTAPSSAASGSPRRRRFFLFLGVSVVVVTIALMVLGARQPAPAPSIYLQADQATPEFERVTQAREFVFPEDHGPHPDYRTEWWYYTGNLMDEQGNHFGYQLTFFRRALAPGNPQRESELAAHQIYSAHFALTNVAGNWHREAERFSRGAAGLAGASGSPYHVWLENWSVESTAPDGNRVRLKATEGGLSIDLELQATKPIVAHGDGGVSRKGDEAGNASYYLSFTRLLTEGALTIDGRSVPVHGESWFDHEWGTSALGPEAIGWDWFSLQLDDGHELMFFQIRRADGSLEPASGGTWVLPDGQAQRLSAADVDIDVLGMWRSADSGGEYPAGWRIRIGSIGLDVQVEPWIQDQEMQVSVVYWEGAVRMRGTRSGAEVGGNGYVELTGYAAAIEEVY